MRSHDCHVPGWTSGGASAVAVVVAYDRPCGVVMVAC